MANIIEEMNYKSYEIRLKNLEIVNRKLLKTILKTIPRETVIEVLNELKIIKLDWSKKGQPPIER